MVHYAGGNGEIPVLLPQPVEQCTIDNYNYSGYCTFLNPQLQTFIALFWSIWLIISTDKTQLTTF